MLLRRELRRRGLRYRLHSGNLPGRPDIVFLRQRIAVFCDGDFWHGRDLAARLAKLARGHNAEYWVAKVRRNTERDRDQTRALEESGWLVLRFWESDIMHYTSQTVDYIVDNLTRRRTLHINSRSSSPSSSPTHCAWVPSASNREANPGEIHHPSMADGTSPHVTASTSYT